MTLEEEIKALEQIYKRPISKFGHLEFKNILINYKMSEQFLDRIIDMIRMQDLWDLCSYYQTLSESFINQNIKYFEKHMQNIFNQQKLSLSFILRHKNKLLSTRWLDKNPQISKTSKILLGTGNFSNNSLIGFIKIENRSLYEVLSSNNLIKGSILPPKADTFKIFYSLFKS